MEITYVIRRKEDDLYLSINGKWQDSLNKDCWLTKEQIERFKKIHSQCLNNFLIYTVLNPYIDSNS